jgi:crossover junction endodeoxyribonuclease RusA
MSSSRRPIRIPASRLPFNFAASNTNREMQRPAILKPPAPKQIEARAALALAAAGPQFLALTLPVPPSINHQYATVNGRRLLSSTGRSYKAQVGQLVWLRLTESPNRAVLLSRLQSSSLTLSIRFYFTSALRRDVDGGLKIAQDALCEGLGLNDNRIVETHLYKHVDRTNPRIEVLLSAASLADVSQPACAPDGHS